MISNSCRWDKYRVDDGRLASLFTQHSRYDGVGVLGSAPGLLGRRRYINIQRTEGGVPPCSETAHRLQQALVVWKSPPPRPRIRLAVNDFVFDFTAQLPQPRDGNSLSHGMATPSATGWQLPQPRDGIPPASTPGKQLQTKQNQEHKC